MKVASITETKNNLSALLDQVRQGETVLIVDRGRPIARLEPAIVDATEGPEGRLARLERQGLVKRAAEPPSTHILKSRPPRMRSGGSLVEAVIEERRQGR
jgi:prevent-host-death family protein